MRNQDKKKQAHRALNCDVLKAYPRYCLAGGGSSCSPRPVNRNEAVALTVGIPIYYVNGSFQWNETADIVSFLSPL